MPRLAPFALACLLLATTARAEWYEREEAIMGTRIAVQLWATDPDLAARAMDAVMVDMHRTDELMSTYKPESQLSQVNAHAFERPVKVDPDIIDVVEKSLEYSRLSDGAFDITYASVGYLYDYREHVHPTQAQIDAALPSVDYRQLRVDRKANTIRFLHRGMRIDLGGIAKGWAVDRGVEILRRMGIEHAMVNAGGDTRLLGDRLGKPWVVGIRDPRKENAVVTRIPLRGRGHLHLGRLRAVLRGGRRPLPPHPGAGHRQVARTCAQRHGHRGDGHPYRRADEADLHPRRRARHGVRAPRQGRRGRDRG